MSVVEEQAKELGVGAAGGAKDGGQKRDTMIVSVGMLILIGFLLYILFIGILNAVLAFSLAASRSGL